MNQPANKEISAGNDKRLVIYVSLEMFGELEKRARAEDRSISNYTRGLIGKALKIL